LRETLSFLLSSMDNSVLSKTAGTQMIGILGRMTGRFPFRYYQITFNAN
jgi:hypothetical protein